jgi:hypothetical protein
VPFAATLTVGVNACWSPIGTDVGVWLILIGVDQVRPPFEDCEKRISSIPGVVASSSQTA